MMAGLCTETGIFWRYRLAEEQARTVRGRTMDSYPPLTNNVLELLGVEMNAYVMTVISDMGQSGKGNILG